MSESSKESPNPEPESLRDPSSAYRLDLPVEPGYRERPPIGSWRAGYYLSLEALELAKSRPEIFARREELRCHVEFDLSTSSSQFE